MVTFFLVAIMLIFLVSSKNTIHSVNQESFAGKRLNKIQKTINRQKSTVNSIYKPYGKFYRRSCKLNNLDENINYNYTNIYDKIQCSYASLNALSNKLNSVRRLFDRVKRKYEHRNKNPTDPAVLDKFEKYETFIHITSVDMIREAISQLNILVLYLYIKYNEVENESKGLKYLPSTHMMDLCMPADDNDSCTNIPYYGLKRKKDSNNCYIEDNDPDYSSYNSKVKDYCKAIEDVDKWLRYTGSVTPGFSINDIIYESGSIQSLNPLLVLNNGNISTPTHSIRDVILQLFTIYLYIEKDVREIYKQL